jgi:hypothetical protein
MLLRNYNSAPKCFISCLNRHLVKQECIVKYETILVMCQAKGSVFTQHSTN